MKAAEAIYSILSNDAGVTALTSTRIYPLKMPQLEAYPAVVFKAISVDPSNTKSGASTTDEVRMQVDCYVKEVTGQASYYNSLLLATAVRSALESFTGTAGTVLTDGITFLTETESYNNQKGVFQVSTDYSLRIKNPV